MSEAATQLLAVAFITGWFAGKRDANDLAPIYPDSQEIVDFLFKEYKSVVTPAWVDELISEVDRGL